MSDAWLELSRQLSAALDDGSTGGPVVEAEVASQVGATNFDIVVESSGADPADQVVAFSALCDLLATRLTEGVDQALGTLLIDDAPDAPALATGLKGMRRDGGVFTPVLPLSHDQAASLVGASAPLFDFIDDATALIDIAASRDPITDSVAETLLSEIDELVARAAEAVQ